MDITSCGGSKKGFKGSQVTYYTDCVGRMVSRFCQDWPNSGYWSHGQQILPTLGQPWLANHNSGYRSLYFVDVGPTVYFIQDGSKQ